jgi:hypothetical protein
MDESSGITSAGQFKERVKQLALISRTRVIYQYRYLIS